MGQLYNIANAKLYPPLFSLSCLLTLHSHLSCLLSLSSPPSSLLLCPLSSSLLSIHSFNSIFLAQLSDLKDVFIHFYSGNPYMGFRYYSYRRTRKLYQCIFLISVYFPDNVIYIITVTTIPYKGPYYISQPNYPI